MKMPNITKRNWEIDDDKEIVINEKISNYDKIITKKIDEENIVKKSDTKQEIYDVKLTEEDDKFLAEFENKIKEAETFSGDFNDSVLSKKEMEEKKRNSLYSKLILEIEILEKINFTNYKNNTDLIFSKINYKIFENIKNESKKENFLIKNKEKSIYKKIRKLLKIKRTLTLKKNSNDSIIDIKGLNKIYESKTINNHVLKDINLSIKRGEFVVMIGASGSGKTTLMNIISGVDKLTYGEIIVNNLNISRLKESELTNFRLENIGYIFQNYGLIPNLTVEENVSIGSFMSFLSKKQKRKIKYDNYVNQIRVDEILENLKLADIKNKMPYKLSGGQKQRVSIGRTIAKKTPIIFADEPTSALDENNARNVIELLKTINTIYKTTIIMITHNDKELEFASRVIRLKDGQII
ncbi:MAG: ABC transporter ATP-binding protein [Mycoplasmoidaceae bacterium]